MRTAIYLSVIGLGLASTAFAGPSISNKISMSAEGAGVGGGSSKAASHGSPGHGADREGGATLAVSSPIDRFKIETARPTVKSDGLNTETVERKYLKINDSRGFQYETHTFSGPDHPDTKHDTSIIQFVIPFNMVTPPVATPAPSPSPQPARVEKRLPGKANRESL